MVNKTWRAGLPAKLNPAPAPHVADANALPVMPAERLLKQVPGVSLLKPYEPEKALQILPARYMFNEE